MALLTCPECDGKVSSFADKCPHCGYPFQEATTGSTVTETRQSEITVPQMTAEESVNHRLKTLNAFVDNCVLNFDDLSIPNIHQIIDTCRNEFVTGAITGLHISGRQWQDKDVEILVDSLLPEQRGKPSRRERQYAAQLLPALITLTVSQCPKMGYFGLCNLSRLDSLNTIDLKDFALQPTGEISSGEVSTCATFVELSNLRSIVLPIAANRNNPATFESAKHWFQEKHPNATVR